MSKKAIKIVLHLVGPLIFLYIISQISFSNLLASFSVVNVWLILAAFLAMILEIFVKAIRWRVILASLDIHISKTKSVSLFWLGAFAGIVTPGRLGELAKVYFLKNKGNDAFRSFFSVILDRLIDIVFLLFLGLLIFAFYLRSLGSYLIVFGAAALLATVLIFVLLDQRSLVNKLFGRLLKFVVPINFDDYNRFTFAKFWNGLRGLKAGDLLHFSFYLLAAWLLYFLSRYLIALSLGLDLSFIDIAVVSVAIAIVSALPISVAGLGTREAIVIYFFGLFGIKPETALLFSLLILVTDLLSVACGFIPYYKEASLIDRVKALEEKESSELKLNSD